MKTNLQRFKYRVLDSSGMVSQHFPQIDYALGHLAALLQTGEERVTLEEKREILKDGSGCFEWFHVSTVSEYHVQ